MKILMINKFLYPNGGSETYIFKLGDYLKTMGHEVEYFGMEHEGRCVGNSVNAYTSDMDFHTASGVKKISYALKTVYSKEARQKIRKVLDDFQPDVCHLNNFNYQLTPSIILEIKKWSKETNTPCKIIYTAHDYQLVCPNHMCNNPNTLENCEKCLSMSYQHCITGKCIHGSRMKSIIGACEAQFWNAMKVYEEIDTIICCSSFMKSKLDKNKILSDKTIVLHNFITKEKYNFNISDKDDYVLYFGRYSKEKGIETLIQACKDLPDIPFVFAGTGDSTIIEQIKALPNVKEVGFLSGETLENTIKKAKFSIYPSEWYENCPFSIIESQMLGTPVVGSNIGGIPELIDDINTGLLFEPKDAVDLKFAISNLYHDEELLKELIQGCNQKQYVTIENYYNQLLSIYKGDTL